MDRLELLDRQIKDQSDDRIPLVLTYHPALNRVYDILRDISNILLVGPEHKKLFQNKIFLSFRRAKNLKDKLVRAKLPNSDDGGLSVKGELNKKILFHLFVAAIISMSTVKKFLKSDMGLRFYGFSKLGI